MSLVKGTALLLFIAWLSSSVSVCCAASPDLHQQVEQLIEQKFAAAQQKVDELVSQVQKLANEKDQMKEQLEQLTATTSAKEKMVDGGVTYVRWGRRVCNATEGALLIYAGHATGSRNDHTGSGANMLCLPENPEWDVNFAEDFYLGYLYGMEYQFDGVYAPNGPFSTENNNDQELDNHPAPCSVCYVPSRTAKLMIPAGKTCPNGWTREYGGYIVSNRNDLYKIIYECWDAAPEIAVGGLNANEGFLYPTKVHCGNLPCSNYNGWEVTCVVCTR